jgi:hypothetical protein
MDLNIIITKLLNNISIELKKEKNMDKIKNDIIEPIINNTIYQLYPYFLIFIISMIILFISIFAILFLNIKLCYK